jgi:hypothetical protein
MIKSMVDLNRKKQNVSIHTKASGGNLKGLAGLGK